MALRKNNPYAPQIYHYLKKYQDDPTSRVFAPLAEAYRKAGLPDEAIEICREGLRVHPTFVGGRVALARALFDRKRYEEVVDELKPVIEDVPDNLVGQRLLAESNLMLGRVAEALAAYKMLLYFNPNDQETAEIVWELEGDAYQKGALVLRSDVAEQPVAAKPADNPEESEDLGGFNIRPVQSAIEDDPEARRALWRRRINLLQGLLQRVERYRLEDERTGTPGA